MDLVTKGEAPFSNLVKAQVLAQPPRREESQEAPNGGRKSLLFSDGRQKAARLARDIPREVEQDSFRLALALAVLDLREIPREARPASDLYVAFVGVAARHHLAFFDRNDQRALLTHARRFLDEYEGELSLALDDRWVPNPIPPRYQEALLRQLCSRFYSLASTTLGYVAPGESPMRLLTRDIAPLFPGVGDPERRAIAEVVATTWIAHLLQDDLAFDASTVDSARTRSPAIRSRTGEATGASRTRRGGSFRSRRGSPTRKSTNSSRRFASDSASPRSRTNTASTRTGFACMSISPSAGGSVRNART